MTPPASANFRKPSLQAAHATSLRFVACLAFRYGFLNAEPTETRPRNP